VPRRVRAAPVGGGLLAGALRVLGMAPTYRELGVVAESLRGTDAERALRQAAGDQEGWGRLVGLAEANGSSGFVTLDLVTVTTTGTLGLATGEGSHPSP
jgi:hypothetical protein